MSLAMPEEKKTDFELCPPGNYIAICYSIVHLGTQKYVKQDRTEGERVEFHFSWELHGNDVLMGNGQPFTQTKYYTYSSHEKATLRKHLESWLGRGFTKEELGTDPLKRFQIKSMVGKACLMQLVHREVGDKTYVNIDSIMSLMQPGTVVPQMVNKPVYFDMTEYKHNVFESLPNYLKEKIAKSPEYNEIKKLVEVATGHQDAPIPFE